MFVEKLTKILVETADNAHVKKSKIRKTGSENYPPWFDAKCPKTKQKITVLGRKIQRKPDNSTLRTELSKLKRDFKNLVRE